MPSIDSVGCPALRAPSGEGDGRFVDHGDGSRSRGLRAAITDRRARPPALVLSLHELGLHRARHLGGEVDVTRQLRRCTSPGSACRSSSPRTRATGSACVAGFLPPVASATAQSIARRAWSFCVETVIELERRVLGHVLLPEAAQHVAVGGRERRDLAAALRELGQRADERRAEVRDDDVDLRVLGDRRREHLLASSPGPSSSPRTAARR